MKPPPARTLLFLLVAAILALTWIERYVLGVFALVLGAFALPHFVFPRDARVLRELWWALPIIPALLVVAYEIDTQHTYLNPLHPDHARLAADRVVALSEKEYRNVLAAQYADWVLNYARQLDSKGSERGRKGILPRGIAFKAW